MPSRSQFLATKETVTKKFRPTGPERPAPVVPNCRTLPAYGDTFGLSGFTSTSSSGDILRTDRCALHKLPRSAERHSETSNHYEADVGHEINVVRTQNERDSNTEFGPIGKQAEDEYKAPGTRMVQVQSQGAIEAEDCHYGRADSDVVVAGNKREQRDEERVHEANETACRKTSGRWLGAIAYDLPWFQCDHDEEQADQRPRGL
jgi:hypothetical protein